MQFTAEKRGVLEMQKFHPILHQGVDVRTILSEPKFLGYIITRLSYPWCSAARERASRKIGRQNKQLAFFCNWDFTQRTSNPAPSPKRQNDSYILTNFMQPEIPKAVVVLRS